MMMMNYYKIIIYNRNTYNISKAHNFEMYRYLRINFYSKLKENSLYQT
jgi:hypothetical protein